MDVNKMEMPLDVAYFSSDRPVSKHRNRKKTGVGHRSNRKAKNRETKLGFKDLEVAVEKSTAVEKTLRKKKKKKRKDVCSETIAKDVDNREDVESGGRADVDQLHESRREKRKRYLEPKTETCENTGDLNVEADEAKRPSKKRKDDDTKNKIKCDVFTNAERAAVGPVWKFDDNLDKCCDEDDGHTLGLKRVSDEMDLMWSDSNCSDEDEEDLDGGNDDEDDDDDDDDDDGDDGNLEELDNSKRIVSKKRPKYLMPNVDFNDLKPIDDEEMERLINLKIVIDWKFPLWHRSNRYRAVHFERDRSPSQNGFTENRQMKIRVGRFSYSERETIINRFHEFRTLYGVRNPLYYLGIFKSKIPNHEKRNFIRFLGKGMNNRTLAAISMAARMMFNPYHYLPLKNTREEMKRICKLVKKYGHKWTKISHVMKRHRMLLCEAYHNFKGRYKAGRWSSAEYRRLIAAMVALTGERDLRKLHHRLPWTQASQIMGTRNPYNCRWAWLHVLSKYIFAEGGRRWNLEDTVRLIEMLHDGQYPSELDIPWSELYPLFDMTNCSQLIHRWGILRQEVPGYYLMSYEDQVEYVYEHLLPGFKNRLKARQEKRLKALQRAKEKQLKLQSTKANEVQT